MQGLKCTIDVIKGLELAIIVMIFNQHTHKSCPFPRMKPITALWQQADMTGEEVNSSGVLH